ncbi:DoxX family protein [Bacteroidota bacterium]
MKWFEERKDWAAIPLRLIAGIIFVMSGFPKLFVKFGDVTGFFDSLGIPFPAFFVLVVGVVEFFGGIALILGAFTRYVSVLQGITMIVAILLVHLSGGYESALMLLMANLALLFTGGGKLSIDEKYGLCK